MIDQPPSATGNRQGMALLLALGVITILLATALEFHRQVRTSLALTGVTRDRALLREIAHSGIHLAMAILLKDRNETETDTLQEGWADSEFLAAAVSELDFDRGKLTINIEDEMGRLQINALVKPPQGREFNPKQLPLWERYLDRLISDLKNLESDPPLEFPEETNTNTIINTVKDWLDGGDDDATTGLTGAENDYYAEMDPPYTPPNSTMVVLPELLSIKGITPELFYGHGEVPGMGHTMTVHGLSAGRADLTYTGKININTAGLAVLRALLPAEFSDLAEAIDAYRRPSENGDEAADLTTANWLQNIPGAGDINVDTELITFQSDLFRVNAVAGLDNMRETLTAIIQRYQAPETGKFQCRIIQWVGR